MNDNFELDSQNSLFLFNDDSETENDSPESQINKISLQDMLKIFEDNTYEETQVHKKTSNLFKTSISTNDTSLIKKKRGRLVDSENKNIKKHDKFSPDNIQRKIQVHYLNFIICFINDILEYLGIREKFLNISYEFKKVVNKQQFNILKSSTIGKIFSYEISTKYKKEENFNSNLYEIFEKNKVLPKLFDMNYLTFFQLYYMKKEKSLDLKIFGIDKEITLSKKTKTYYDLIEKFKKDENYINHINDCINKNYY